MNPSSQVASPNYNEPTRIDGRLLQLGPSLNRLQTDHLKIIVNFLSLSSLIKLAAHFPIWKKLGAARFKTLQQEQAPLLKKIPKRILDCLLPTLRNQMPVITLPTAVMFNGNYDNMDDEGFNERFLEKLSEDLIHQNGKASYHTYTLEPGLCCNTAGGIHKNGLPSLVRTDVEGWEENKFSDSISIINFVKKEDFRDSCAFFSMDSANRVFIAFLHNWISGSKQVEGIAVLQQAHARNAHTWLWLQYYPTIPSYEKQTLNGLSPEISDKPTERAFYLFHAKESPKSYAWFREFAACCLTPQMDSRENSEMYIDKPIRICLTRECSSL